MTILLLASIPIFIGSLIQGCVGFGLSLVSVTPLLFLLPKEQVAPILIIASLIQNGYALRGCYKKVQLKPVLLLTAGSIAGVPLGIYLLQAINEHIFKFSIGLLVALVGVLLKLNKNFKSTPTIWNLSPTGFVSGVLNGSVGLNGPPVILFFAQAQLSKVNFRANLFAFFFCSNVFAITIFIFSEAISLQNFLDSLILIPFLLVGTTIGARFAGVVSERLFRTLTLFIVIAMGVSLMATNWSGGLAALMGS